MNRIMRRQNSQFTVPNWLKWGILGLILVLTVCFIYLFSLYRDIEQGRTANYQDSKDEVLDKTKITEIEKVTQYNGASQFHVIFGSTNNGENKIVFAPLNNKDAKLTVIDMSKIITKQQVMDQWKQQCQACEFVDITPALEDDKALWEITYIDNKNRYIFDYLSIYDGKRVQQYRLKSIFH